MKIWPYNVLPRFANWDWRALLRVANDDKSTAVLTRRHIYILPTRFGVMFGLVLIAMLLGSINYSLNLGFALTFLLVGLGHAAMLHTWRNLAHLELLYNETPPTHAGEQAYLQLIVKETKNRARYAIALECHEGLPSFIDIPALGNIPVSIALPTQGRGYYPVPKLKLYSVFPLSLFYVWAYARFEQRYWVYPLPAEHSEPPSLDEHTSDEDRQHASAKQMGHQEFDGHRPYRTGDSPRNIDWKASSRQDDWLVKEYASSSIERRFFRWQDTRAQDPELRIGELTRWILDADQQQQTYGLRIPRGDITPSQGEQHKRACLEALTLMQVDLDDKPRRERP